jgi:hypothetical protein
MVNCTDLSRFFLLLAIHLGFCVAALGAEQPSAFESANRLFSNGRYQEAADTFREIPNRK